MPVSCQAITWTNFSLLSLEPLIRNILDRNLNQNQNISTFSEGNFNVRVVMAREDDMPKEEEEGDEEGKEKDGSEDKADTEQKEQAEENKEEKQEQEKQEKEGEDEEKKDGDDAPEGEGEKEEEEGPKVLQLMVYGDQGVAGPLRLLREDMDSYSWGATEEFENVSKNSLLFLYDIKLMA